MKIIRNTILVLFALISVSCATAYQGIESAIASGVTFVANTSEVSVLGKNNAVFLDDSLSYEATQRVKKAIESNLIVGVNSIIDCSEDVAMHAEISRVLSIASATPRRHLSEIVIDGPVYDLLKQSQDRFAVVVWHDGFTREKGSYGKQMALGLGLAVLTTIATAGAATGYFVPEKANSRVSVMVVDTQTGQIAAFRIMAEEAEPLKDNVILRELESDLRRIFR